MPEAHAFAVHRPPTGAAIPSAAREAGSPANQTRTAEPARPEDGESHLATITEMAARFAVTPRALRFYEDEGLISPQRVGLNRFYSKRDRARLAWILRAKNVGFSLSEIKDMIDLYDLGDGRVAQRRVTIAKCRERVASMQQQMADLQATIAELDSFIALLVERERTDGPQPEAG